MVLLVLAVTSGLLFLRYGFDVLFRTRLRAEFTRYGMPRMRTVVGLLEMLGGAADLTTLMILGIAVRIRIHDAPRLMLPAVCLAGLNAVLVVLFLSS